MWLAGAQPLRRRFESHGRHTGRRHPLVKLIYPDIVEVAGEAVVPHDD
jgi:hypothetical protein